MKSRQRITRFAALVSTVALAWGVLTMGYADEAAGGPQVGEIAGRDYRARKDADFVDEAATAQAEERARQSVDPRLTKDAAREEAAYTELQGILDAVAVATRPLSADLEAVPTPTSSTSTTTTTSTSVDGGQVSGVATEEALLTGVVTGSVYIDVNGDATFNEEIPEGDGWTPDRPWSGIDVVAVADADGSQYRATTDRNGEFSIDVHQGDYLVIIDAESSSYPDDFVASAPNNFAQEITCASDQCPVDPVGLTAVFASLDTVVEDVESESPLLGTTTWGVLASYGMRDVYRDLFGDELLLDQISVAAQDRLATYFRFEITDDEVDERRADALSDVQSVRIDGVRDDVAKDTVNRLVSVSLVANMVVDEEATNRAIVEAVAGVQPVTRSYTDGELIVGVGDTFTERTLQAVNATGANLERTVRQAATGGLLGVLVAVLAFYLAKFRRVYWDRPRMVTLFGMLIVLAAAAVRFTVEFQEASSWYILPAVAFGYLASVLLDRKSVV